MQTHLAHMQINVEAANMAFYRDLLTFLGWPTLMDNDEVLGMGGATSLWFIPHTNGATNDFDGPGINHIGFSAESQADVDAAAGYLRDHNIGRLFDTPRHRPEFAGDEASTYYQVMFETPDRLLIEVVYTGPKSG